jgi:hypothetical protein
MVIKKSKKIIARKFKQEGSLDTLPIKLGKPVPVTRFTYVPSDEDFEYSKLSKQTFDKVIYPLKALVPKDRVKELGLQSYIQTKIDGKRNVIKYYCKNPVKLTLGQLETLYKERDDRYTYGYLINDRHITAQALNDYLKYVDTKARATDDKYKKIDIYNKELSIGYQDRVVQNYTGLKKQRIQEQRARRLGVGTAQEKQKINDSMVLPISGVRLPDGSRLPTTGIGLNTYFKKNNLKTTTDIITCFGSGKDRSLIVKDYVNLGYLLQDININAQEAFQYICTYLNHYPGKRKIHTEDRERSRGGLLLDNLFKFFDAEHNRTLEEKKINKKIKVYSQKDLMQSEQYANYCLDTGIKKETNIKTFNKWVLAKRKILKNIF